MPPTHRTPARGATSWALSQHIAGERRGAARPLLILWGGLVKREVRNASSVSLTLYIYIYIYIYIWVILRQP